MPTDTLNLGEIITTDQHRDAVHVAVAPVTAAGRLSPGEPVGFVGDTPGTVGAVNARHKSIGIVDPFLKGPVFKGERFWLFLYPGSITSLRHEWEHPAFGVATADADAEAKAMAKATAKAWIEELARKLRQPYEDLMAAALLWVEDGDYTNLGSERHKDVTEATWFTFWKHWSRLTGRTCEAPESFYNCVC